MKRISLISSVFVVILIVLYYLRIDISNKSKENIILPDNNIVEADTPFYFSFTQLTAFYPLTLDSIHQIISYSAFDLSYNELNEQADWVIYLLTKLETSGKIERKDNFQEDKNIKSGSAKPQDYKSSGYDKGHLAPAADMKWSETAMNESFLMSNMSPQTPQFNRGIWKELEEQVRNWAITNDSIIVVTGPVFKEIKGTIGKNKVTIPGYYFKVILDISWPDYKAIAFLMKNEKSDLKIESFAISIDSLEMYTGINFFYHFDKTKFDKLEKTLELNLWY